MTKCISRVRQDTIDLVERLWTLSPTVSVQELLERACYEARDSVTVNELKGRSREGRICAVREAVMYFLRVQKGMSLQKTSDVFHRDHTMTVYAVNKIRSEIQRLRLLSRREESQQLEPADKGEETLVIGTNTEDAQHPSYFLQLQHNESTTRQQLRRFDSYISLVGGIVAYCGEKKNRAPCIRIVYQEHETMSIAVAERAVLEGIVQMHNRLTRLEQLLTRAPVQNSALAHSPSLKAEKKKYAENQRNS